MGSNAHFLSECTPTIITQTFFLYFQVNDKSVVVKNSNGTIVDSQLVEVDNVTSNLRKTYVKAYLGITPDKPPRYWLVFQASVPPMGWNSYFISRPTGAGKPHQLKYLDKL